MCHAGRKQSEEVKTHLLFAELQGTLVLAHLEQLRHPLLIGCKACYLPHNFPNEFDTLAEPLHSTHFGQLQETYAAQWITRSWHGRSQDAAPFLHINMQNRKAATELLSPQSTRTAWTS